jgi:enoyl-CoA hydratase
MSEQLGETVLDAAEDCEFLDVEIGQRAEYVATVTIDRPDARNALNTQLREELKSVFRNIDDSDVRVIVLTGADEANAFVAGADVTDLRERNAFQQRDASKRPRVYETVADVHQPVIARINGHALGGGSELALACDVRIAHERAKLGQPEINLGIIPGGGGTQRLPRQVGPGQAKKLILSGELVDAAEAKEIGYVEEVHDDAAFDDRVYGLAESMASKSPVALEFAKEAVDTSQRTGLREGIDHEAELFAQLFATHDKDEGIDAFLEDREPEWEGR